MNRLTTLFKSCFNTSADTITPLSGGGSNRKYFRLSNSEARISCIGTIGNDVKENATFIYLDDCFSAYGINVPKIYKISDDQTAYLQEDLGDTSLFDCRGTDSFYRYLENAIRKLPEIQRNPNIDFNKCYPETQMGLRQISWDLNYFKYCFLKPSGVSFNETELEDDFEKLSDDLNSIPEDLIGFMYRDCQSRNIMIKNDGIFWIDFQSGRKGPALYDVASLLWQAKANISASKRNEFAEKYFKAYSELTGCNIATMRDLLPTFVLFRVLQVLGAYGFRGLVEHKSHFVESIPFAIQNLISLADDGVLDKYPQLLTCARSLGYTNMAEPWNRIENKLVVTVLSFSYKKGYPEDRSGNGGGFMFDCRALHNPGRYEEYKQITGRDNPVIEFLEKQGEVQPFLNNIFNITDNAIQRYITRGFSSIQIGFGCTGGQHRSVYCAEKTARHIVQKFADKIEVRLIHREQNINKVL